MKKITKFKKTSLLVFSLVMMSFGAIKISNINSAHAETKIYNGQPYDIVVKYEPLERKGGCPAVNGVPYNCEVSTIEELKEADILIAKKQGFVTEKIPGTGTPEGDLQKVKQHIELRKKDVIEYANQQAYELENNIISTLSHIDPETGLILNQSSLPNECDSVQVYTVNYKILETIVPVSI